MKRQKAAGENSSGFTNEQSLQGGAFRGGGLLDQKSTSLLFSRGGVGVGGRRGHGYK